MTKEMLDDYRSKKEEIKELVYQLEHLGEGDAMIGNDVILDYRSGYPVPQSVVGVDWEKVDRKVERIENKIERLHRECQEVEDFIDNIQESLTRRIFRMCYLEGKSQKEVGRIIHMDKSNISRKIDKYLKIATNATNATL